MPVDQFGEQRDEAASVGEVRWFSVAHVDQVAAIPQDRVETSYEAGSGFHGAQSRVADLDRDDLGPGGQPVAAGLVGVVGGNDAGNVRSVGSGGGDNRKQVALVEDVDGEVEQAGRRERGVHRLVAVRRQHGFVRQVAVLVGVDSRPPAVSVVEDDAVKDGAGVAEF